MAGYEPPSGATTVPNPRLLSDIPQELAVHYIASICAFIHYDFLVAPRSGLRSRIIPLVTQVCFPMLPVVCQCINLVKLVRCVVQQHPRIANLRHAIAGTFGQRTGVYPSSYSTLQEHHLLDVDEDEIEAKILPYCSVRYLLRTALLLATMIVLGLYIAVYNSRLGIRYHGATYVGVLGLDHRMGWMAIGSFVAVLFSVPLHLINTQWTVRQKAALPGSTSQGYREAIVAAAVAAMIQDLLLAFTNRPSTLEFLCLRTAFCLPTVCAVAVFALAYRFRRLVPRRIVTTAIFLWLLAIATLQLMYDIEEITEIHGEVYHPWNYRWAVKTPPWR